MMINFIIVLAIVAIGAWLGNVLMTVEQRVSQARQRVRGDGLEVVVLRRPVQRAADAAGIGDHGRDVAGPARGMLNCKIAPGDAPHRRNRFEH